MDGIGSRIRDRRRVLGRTLQEVADAVGCGRSYLSQIETGRRERLPSRELLEKLESVLGMGSGSLVGVADWASTPDEVRARVRDLEQDREAARLLIEGLRAEGVDALHGRGELARLVRRVEGADEGGGVEPIGALPMRVPVINKVAAGYPTEFTDMSYPARVADDYVSVPDLYDGDAFAARVFGDSMSPRYAEGDIVVFSPGAAVKSGSDCFVRFERDAETTFKRVFFDDAETGEVVTSIRLQPLNAAYPARVVDREAIAGMYAAVYVIRAV